MSTTAVSYSSVNVGDERTEEFPALTRTMFVKYAGASGDFNPIHYDEEYARAAGYPTVVAPPTFPACFHSSADLRELLGVGIKSLLHAEQSFEYERPILAGDRIFVATRVADVQERTGPAGRMDVAVLEDEGRDEEGALVFRARRTLVVRAAKEA